MAMAEPDRLDHEVTTWLHLLYDGCETGWLSLFSLDRRNGDRHVDWAPVDDYDALAEAAATRAPHCCVWLGMATRHRRLQGNQRGRAEDCHELPGLWLDIDVAGPTHQTTGTLPPDRDAAWALIGDFPLPPTAVVDSGGGLQAHWLFAEPLDALDAGPLLDRWGAKWTQLADARGWHLDNVFDVARVMRLPGTTNRKGDPASVTVVAVEDRRWGVDDLDQWLIDPPQPARSAAEPRVPYIGPTRPGDAFDAQHGAGEVLAAHGWTHARTDRNGDQHWCRPGKEAREGTSATIYAEDGHCTIWSSTAVARWPTLEVRRPYDAFGLFTHLAHGGDWRRASDELEARGYGTKARPDAIVLHPRPVVEGETTEGEAVDYFDPDLDEFLGVEDDDYDWLVEGLLERGDRTIVTGPEGGGKSTLLRQLAIQMASGIHPFTLDRIDPLQVLLVDCENSARQARRALRGLRDTAGDSYCNGKLRLRVLGHSIELAKVDVMADIGARIEAQEVDVLIIGPLYKLLDDDPVKELPAKAVADAIDWLRGIRQSAILIEAHSPYADGGGKARPVRPYGASLWSRWPEFGMHLGADGVITHWRGQRDERSWPPALERATPWPWAPKYEVSAEPRAWDPVEQCEAAVVAFINEVGGDFSLAQLGKRLRERGTKWRDSTISVAVRNAANKGLIDTRSGPHGALVCSPAMDRLGIVLDPLRRPKPPGEEEF